MYYAIPERLFPGYLIGIFSLTSPEDFGQEVFYSDTTRPWLMTADLDGFVEITIPLTPHQAPQGLLRKGGSRV